MAEVNPWAPGTLYQPGDLVRPTGAGDVSQGELDNPSFEDGNSDWTTGGTSGTATIEQVAPTYDGTWRLRLQDLTPGSEQYTTKENNARVLCVPGQIVIARCYAQCFDSNDETRALISIRWYDAANAFISSSYMASDPTIVDGIHTRITPANPAENGIHGGLIGLVAFGAYVQLAVQGIAPANAAKFSVMIQANWLQEGGWWFDTFTLDFGAQPAANPFIFQAVQAAAGFSGSSEPTWPTVLGNQVVDNEVTWEAVSGNSVTWKASRILVSGAAEPVWPLVVGGGVADNTISWLLDSRRVVDERVPTDSRVVLLASSKVFAGDGDIIDFSATVNPLDWSTPEDAGFIGFGLQQYGGSPVTAVGLYRGNLAAFNSQGCQLWQLDEDPAGITYLDGIPVACTYPKTVQPVGDDLGFLSDLGIRSLGLSGAAVNLQGGYFGQQVDPITKTLLAEAIAASYEPMALYWPARGQAWWFFGDEALVLTINAGPDERPRRSWSRYTFPWTVTDWTIQGTDLVLRAGELVLVVDPDELCDDVHNATSDVVNLNLGIEYEADAWADAADEIELDAVFNFVNGTPVYLFGTTLTGPFTDLTVTALAGADTLTASAAVTADAGDVVIIRYLAEGPFTVEDGNTVGSEELTLNAAPVRYLARGSVLRITHAGGTDYNFIARDVDVDEAVIPLAIPLEAVAISILVYPVGTTLLNDLDATIAYVPIELAAPAVASTTLELVSGIPAAAAALQAIVCPYQVTAVAGGQASTTLELEDPTEFEITGGGAGSFTREVFLNTTPGFGDNWNVPTGVTSLEILAVSAGAIGAVGTDSFEFFGISGGGGGGGAVLVVHGVPVAPGEGLNIHSGINGDRALVRRNAGGATLAETEVPGVAGAYSAGVGPGSQDGNAATGANIAPNGGTIDAGSRGGGGGGGAWVDAGGGSPGVGGAGSDGSGAGGGASNAGPAISDNSSGGGGGAGGAGTNGADETTPGNGGNGIIPPNHSFGAWGTDIGENGYFGGGGWGAEADASATVTLGSPGLGSGADGTGGAGGMNADGTTHNGYRGLVAIVYGEAAVPPDPPEAGYPSVAVAIAPFLVMEECTPFTGVIQWPFLDMKAPGTDKEMIGFDLVIDGDAELSVGYNQRELEYDVAGSWTAPYTVNGDTLPDDVVAYSVTGPTLSLRLEFEGEQAWEWFSANLYLKDAPR